MKFNRLIVFFVFGILCAVSVSAAPVGPVALSVAQSNARNLSTAGITVLAEAGNVSELVITSVSVTDKWQGYYGNVTHTITLDDANNKTMYDWRSASPTGEIYASNSSSVTWADIECQNLSTNYLGDACGGSPETCLNISEIEAGYGANPSGDDGVDETFNVTPGNGPTITVGATPLSLCYWAKLYSNDVYDHTGTFNETILTVNNTNTLIFASIVNVDQTGFDNGNTDFEMIVLEDGSAAATTNYYFFVELV
ncbi:MAG: hypothetical protein ABH879_07860 [archaeon]